MQVQHVTQAAPSEFPLQPLAKTREIGPITGQAPPRPPGGGAASAGQSTPRHHASPGVEIPPGQATLPEAPGQAALPVESPPTFPMAFANQHVPENPRLNAWLWSRWILPEEHTQHKVSSGWAMHGQQIPQPGMAPPTWTHVPQTNQSYHGWNCAATMMGSALAWHSFTHQQIQQHIPNPTVLTTGLDGQ